MRITRVLLIAVWAAGLLAALVTHVRDSRRRDPAAEFVREYTVSDRRPSHAEAVGYAPSADLAFEAVAGVALQDSLGSVTLDQLDPATRQLWIASVARFDDELRDGSSLLLDAIALRPGWPNHRGLLGQIEFMRARRQMRLAQNPERWFVPLRSAIVASPSKDAFAVFAAGAAMETWPYLAAENREQLEPFFRTAMEDHRFVRVAYGDLLNMVGRDTASRWLGESPASIDAAMDIEARAGNVAAVADLHRRWERAEWRSRVAGLQAMEERARLGDELGLRRLAHAWVRSHGFADFDHVEGRRQVSRVLALWPAEAGEWRRDPRASIVQYFLNGRLADGDPSALSRAVSHLSGTPDVVLARVALFAGDDYGAERMAAASETRGAFEWTRFYVELARYHLAAGRIPDARAALGQISPAARLECDVVLTQSLVDGVAAQNRTAPLYWAGPSLPLCIEPGTRELQIAFEAPSPAVVSYGFNGGRLGTAFAAPGRTELTIPVPSEGRHIFSIQRIAGEPVAPVAASVR